MVLVPVDENAQADVSEVKKAISSNTVLIVMSAPQYPHGVVDPISEVGELAQAHGLFARPAVLFSLSDLKS